MSVPEHADCQARTTPEEVLNADLEARLRAVVDLLPRCEMRPLNETCERPAHVLRISAPCGHTFYACAICHEGWETDYARHEMAGETIVVSCQTCGGPVSMPIEWRPL